MIELDLDDNERQILAHAPDSYLSDLRMEIAHTDSFDFRQMLKERKAVLIGVLESLRRSNGG
ncbi:MAG: hypothetical protein ACE5GX_14685 [Thermoanaerobaculia bacterium]